jgi:membrane-bound lytic murein transglycosylase D
LKNSRLKIGQRLSIYPKKIAITKANLKALWVKNRETSNKKGSFKTYIVRKGDSLCTISRKFMNVSMDEIKKWNNIWSVKSWKPETKLKIYKS